ncbi:hypothetical protein K2173_026752 [Erythroxylum novogranatense]|uniref:Uncharacterized protein n=1 Tax=Erythroxylum novogranatense TaxID=1862640 RepID=A0AAV8TZI2_9ROSI|nr:hypothetical protein K2173_026752 [Erythroxylum novogranatense]
MGTDNIDNAKAGTGLLEENLDMVTIMLEKDGIEVLAHIPIKEKGKSISMEDTSPSLSKGPEPSQLNNSHTTNDQELVGVIDLYCKEKHVIVDKGEESTNMEIVVGSVDRGWTDSCEDSCVQLPVGVSEVVTYSFLAEDETTSVIADVHISIGDVVTGDEDNGN